MCNMYSTSKQGMKIHVQRAINMDCAKIFPDIGKLMYLIVVQTANRAKLQGMRTPLLVHQQYNLLFDGKLMKS